MTKRKFSVRLLIFVVLAVAWMIGLWGASAQQTTDEKLVLSAVEGTSPSFR